MSFTDSMEKLTRIFLLTHSLALAFGNFFATKGLHFETILDKKSFFKDEHNIEFSVSLDGMPDLPTWLKFEQQDPSADGVLYGTPDKGASTIGLSIAAWNKETYETVYRLIILSVMENTPEAPYKVEFKLNGEPSSLIGNLQPFLKMVDTVWEGSNHISHIEKSSTRGRELSEGLFVRISGRNKYSDWMRELLNSSDSQSCNKLNRNPMKTMFADASFDIDWCSFTDGTREARSEDSQEFSFDEHCQYHNTVLRTTKWDNSTPDMTNDVVYVCIGVGVGLLLIVFTTSVMFCQREGLQNNISSKPQLSPHKTLRRVGSELCYMSAGKTEERSFFPYGRLDEDIIFESSID